MRICVLHPSYAGSSSVFSEHDPDCDPSPYLAGHEVESARIDRARAVRQVRRLAARCFDVFVNLCDGAWDEDRAGIEVVETLESLGVAFTGAGSAFFDPGREAVKLACHYAGIDTPAFVMVRDDTDLAAAARLSFPLFVKHPSSYGSIGLTRRSRVEDPGALREEAGRMRAAYGAALVEEFIAGREFTVLVAEGAEGADGTGPPHALDPVEYQFPAGESFKHFDLKWIEFAAASWQPVADPGLRERLLRTAREAFSALDGSGYARLDLRLGADGRLFLLDVNPNCGIFYPPDVFSGADLILASAPLGPRGFLEHVLACALRRRRRTARALLPARDAGSAPRAARDLAAGETILTLEERPARLVSLRHVERSFPPVRRRWFRRHSHPLGDDVYLLWETEPASGGWPSLPHSCDPNALVVALTLVARRPIARGEPVTADHATFRAGEMEEVDCHCGAACCRGRLRADDHLAPWLDARYGDALSAYVKELRRAKPGGARRQTIRG